MSTRLEPMQIGAPPGRLSDWVIAPMHFNNFEGLTTVENKSVKSPVFSCFGHDWLAKIYPGGRCNSRDGQVALGLSNMTEEAIEVEFKFIIKHPNGGEDISIGPGKLSKFSPTSLRDSGNSAPVKLCPNSALRSTLINYLDDGALSVELHMRTTKLVQSDQTCQQSALFLPENHFLRNAILDFGNKETADVEFEVGGAVESGNEGRKRAKTSATTFHAHHYPLRMNAPVLAGICKPGDDSPIEISNVQPEIFKHLLYYCYGGKIVKEDLQANAEDIIEAADRYGIVNLKLEAEACYVDTVELTLDNIVEVVTYADSKNLALLKEHCMYFLSSANKIEVAEKVSFDGMPSHLIKDWMVAIARREGESSKGDKFSIMRVSQLRQSAHAKGLSVDGSREMLIASIKEHDLDNAEAPPAGDTARASHATSSSTSSYEWDSDPRFVSLCEAILEPFEDTQITSTSAAPGDQDDEEDISLEEAWPGADQFFVDALREIREAFEDPVE